MCISHVIGQNANLRAGIEPFFFIWKKAFFESINVDCMEDGKFGVRSGSPLFEKEPCREYWSSH